MRQHFVIAMAVLVTTALVGGVAGVAAGTGPAVEQSLSVDRSADAHGTDGPAIHQTDDPDTCAFPLELTDATGTTVTLDEPPERITTTNPSAAQTLWEIGAQDRVVGLTQFALYLDGADEREDVSAEFGVSVERVVDTDPDLVLAPNASAGQVEELRAQGLTVYHFPAATDIDDIAEKTETIGQLVGECEAAADTNEEMYDAVADVEDRTADLDRPAALYPLGDGFVAAGNTFIDSILTVGGTDNVAAADHEGFPQLSDEVILDTDPELILVTDPDASILDEEPYASTTAGQEESYVVMNENYLNQPAPRSVIESTDTLATAVEELQTESEEADVDDGVDDADDVDDGVDDADDVDDGADDADDVDDGADDADDVDEADDETGLEVPGFGVVPAALALLAAALLARRD